MTTPIRTDEPGAFWQPLTLVSAQKADLLGLPPGASECHTQGRVSGHASPVRLHVGRAASAERRALKQPPRRRPSSVLREFLESGAAGGVLLMAAALLALLVANSPLTERYFQLLHAPLAGLDVLHWINDGLMALFFLSDWRSNANSWTVSYPPGRTGRCPASQRPAAWWFPG